MKLIENMNLTELEAERKTQLYRIDAAKRAIDKIHGTRDYSDDVTKHFHLGKVGFRRDTKKQNQTINRAIDNGVKACKQYDIIADAESKMHALTKAIKYVHDNKHYGETQRKIKDNQNSIALKEAKLLKWEKISGHYGVAYRYGNFVVERVGARFVAVRDKRGNLLSHYKTVKEAKAAVSIALFKR